MNEVADHYADIVVARAQVGLPISTADAQVAAMCRARGAVCATRNAKDFAQTGIGLVDPWADSSNQKFIMIARHVRY